MDHGGSTDAVADIGQSDDEHLQISSEQYKGVSESGNFGTKGSEGTGRIGL